MKNFDLRYLLIPVIIGIFSFWGYHLAIVAMTPRFDGKPFEDAQDIAYNAAIDQFEQNLLKELEEV